MTVYSQDTINAAIVAARLVTGVTMLTAGVMKLRRPGHFLASLTGFYIVPERLRVSISRSLPALEICVGGALLYHFLRPDMYAAGTSLVALSLYLTFTVALVVNVALGHTDVSCGCFGLSNHRIDRVAIARALLLTVLSGLGSAPVSTTSRAALSTLPLQGVMLAAMAVMMWTVSVCLIRLSNGHEENAQSSDTMSSIEGVA
jgi:hypothetical protein